MEGLYKCTNAQILVTSDYEDKANLLDSCKRSTISISGDSITINADCIVDSIIKIKRTAYNYKDSATIASEYLLLTQRYHFPGKDLYKTLDAYFPGNGNSKDSAQLIFLDAGKLLFVYEPYVLEFEKKQPQR